MIELLEIYGAGVLLMAFGVGLFNDADAIDPYAVIITALTWPIVTAGCTGAFIRNAVKEARRRL